MNPSLHEEVGQTARSVVDVMRESPLSLALVVMNFALVVFLFYSNNAVLAQRQSALSQIVDWQQRTDTLMASCVSIEVTKLIVDALERDRNLYRQMLPPLPGMPATPPAEFPPAPRPQSDPVPAPAPSEQHTLFSVPP